MGYRLEGKIAIVTGAAGGIGKAIATTFAREGAKTVCLDIQEENGAAVAEAIKAAGGNALFIKADVTSLPAIQGAIGQALESYGKIDVLVNNAGAGRMYKLHEMDDENDFDFIFYLNIKSYFRLCKLVIPSMIKNNGGSIINTASVGGITAMPGMTSYGATKAAVLEFTKSVAVEYAAHRIRCNAIVPGPTNTALAPPPEFVDSLVPLKRLGEPEEIAAAALFFAGDECTFCTGASLIIDGGLTCGPCFAV